MKRWKKRKLITKIRKGLKRYFRKLAERRTKRRKAAKLGWGRVRRARSKRRAAAIKGRRSRSGWPF